MRLLIVLAIIILSMVAIMLGAEVIVKHTDLSEDQAMAAFYTLIVVVLYIAGHISFVMGVRDGRAERKYTGPERRKVQTLVHPKRRSTDIVGRDNWGGPGRYCR